MKKTEIKKLDKLWALKVKERAGWKCEYCLQEVDVWLNSCHIIGRANRTTRWDLDNGMCLCYVHHKDYDTHQVNHDHIRAVVIGEERMERLKKKKQVIAKHQNFEDIKKELENEI